MKTVFKYILVGVLSFCLGWGTFFIFLDNKLDKQKEDFNKWIEYSNDFAQEMRALNEFKEISTSYLAADVTSKYVTKKYEELTKNFYSKGYVELSEVVTEAISLVSRDDKKGLKDLIDNKFIKAVSMYSNNKESTLKEMLPK